MNKIFRQGDILIRQIDKIPDGLKETNNPILAYGEATGHHHRLLERTQNQFMVLEDSVGNKYLKIEQPTELIHEEHDQITIEKGIYFVIHEREYNYFELESKRVQD